MFLTETANNPKTTREKIAEVTSEPELRVGLTGLHSQNAADLLKVVNFTAG